MSSANISVRPHTGFELSAYVELLKPVTWFPPMWAFACGVISSGGSVDGRWWLIAAGVALVGPMVCGASQVVNDWYDRDVDAINQPERPIPSGRVPGAYGLYFAIVWSLASLLLAAAMSPLILVATALGMVMAWAYSAPPVRLKGNGWFGNLAVGLSYEGLAWVTGSLVLLEAARYPSMGILGAALLYSIGAHGIMTLNDFKSIDGDRRLGIRSIPARYGVERAAAIAFWMMLVPQLLVVLALVYVAAFMSAGLVAALAAGQFLAFLRLRRDPRRYAPWYNAVGVLMYVLGMMVTAFALRAGAWS